ncbi:MULTISPECIES: TetR/AcrR family transcriptional regulator [Metabacillus]|jgi:AcrR family transcriptional regulator|uniref:TetR/AcrR family transcriptional regulator n=1 Tax=Metabacillus rhizolycopersici TaxID=2875709 RepID=A0ABS7URP2_9BACI|nr:MULTISPECIES: TetR/AcrR family transcriptional regulator [Metabacillus]MBZ5750610.1 TetR/AcrR family transcriptional regulator [Metabacillus rhizolycopersici]MCM3651749.1 TetR/AcrR family transcriptional regulator [Metabacillus litoralis]
MDKSIETKKRILFAASELFSIKSYDTITMREIAKRANCSHTTIYLYYKDKSDLLEKLAIPPLLTLAKRIDRIRSRKTLDPLGKLKVIGRGMINFSIENRSLYLTYITVNSIKVDEDDFSSEINAVRNSLFNSLKKVILLNNPYLTEEEALKYGRMIFFQIHGTIMSYINSNEEGLSIRQRVIPILEEALEFLIQGILDKAGPQIK